MGSDRVVTWQLAPVNLYETFSRQQSLGCTSERYSAPHTGFGREGRVGRSGGRVGRTGSVGRWGSVGMERSVHGCGGVEGGNGGDGDDGVEGGSIGGAGGEAGGGLFRMRQTRRYELLDGSTVSA